MKTGVLILCVMSAIWAAWCLGAAHTAPWAYAAAGLVALSPLVLAHGRRFPQTSADQARRVRRLVGMAIAFEAVMIFVGVQGLARMGRPDLIVCLIALAVGLHFFPLARWFPAPTYYVTGLALLIAAVAGVFLPAVDRIAVVAACGGAILWLTALAIVLALPRSEPERA